MQAVSWTSSENVLHVVYFTPSVNYIGYISARVWTFFRCKDFAHISGCHKLQARIQAEVKFLSRLNKVSYNNLNIFLSWQGFYCVVILTWSRSLTNQCFVAHCSCVLKLYLSFMNHDRHKYCHTWQLLLQSMEQVSIFILFTSTTLLQFRYWNLCTTQRTGEYSTCTYCSYSCIFLCHLKPIFAPHMSSTTQVIANSEKTIYVCLTGNIYICLSLY